VEQENRELHEKYQQKSKCVPLGAVLPFWQVYSHSDLGAHVYIYQAGGCRRVIPYTVSCTV
jgi:hypothetical protein